MLATREGLMWCVILYTDDTRTLAGPFLTLREAEKARLRLGDFGDTEIRRVCSIEAIEEAIEVGRSANG